MSLKSELRNKLKFEAEFLLKLRKFNNTLVSAFKSRYLKFKEILPVSEYDDNLIDILNPHYDKVTTFFSDSLKLPKRVTPTPVELNLMGALLEQWRDTHAPNILKGIQATNQLNINLAVKEAIEDELVLGLTGLERDRTITAVSSAKLKIKLFGREKTIASTETQIAAETAKNIEAQVLAGPMSFNNITKEWFSILDSNTRDAHVNADGQIVLINQNFTVGGQALRFPGDRSQGASSDNVISCRCSSVVNREQIIDARR